MKKYSYSDGEISIKPSKTVLGKIIEFEIFVGTDYAGYLTHGKNFWVLVSMNDVGCEIKDFLGKAQTLLKCTLKILGVSDDEIQRQMCHPPQTPEPPISVIEIEE